MKKNIFLAFVLVLICVIAVAGLQLYFTFTSYKVESAAFERNSNEALKEAIDSTSSQRHQQVLDKLKVLLNDTTFVRITCKWNAKYNATQFTVRQVIPDPGEQNELTMSIEYFKERLDSITPESKHIFTEHMVNYVSNELKKGYVWYYTKKLGDSINKAAWENPLDLKDIKKQYVLALKKRDIDIAFSFDSDKASKISFITKKHNMTLTKSDEPNYIQAYFTATNMFLLQQLKWVIISSLILILITLGTFWYMLKILLSQQKLNEIKDDFISNMTHEIHSPLSSVMITAEAMKEFDMTKEERDSYADIILHQSKRLTKLADEILAGAKLEKKGISLNDIVDLNEIYRDIESIYKDKAVIRFSGDTVSFAGNATHFERAITNIIDNAVKYSEGESAKIEIRSFIKGNEIEITIADNGPGIPDAYKTKVFDQFYRMPTGNVHNVKGYGLGLSYVKKVVETHRGVVRVKDNNPSGCVFVIRIPYEA